MSIFEAMPYLMREGLFFETLNVDNAIIILEELQNLDYNSSNNFVRGNYSYSEFFMNV